LAQFIIIDKYTVEIEFKNKYDNILGLLIMKRYFKDYKNNLINSKENDFSITINKKLNFEKPILKLSDFYDKEYRAITDDIAFLTKYI
jgi:hypothetical protein